LVKNQKSFSNKSYSKAFVKPYIMRSLLSAVFKNDTMWRLKSHSIHIALLLFYACTPKPSFYFPASKGSLIHEGHARAQSNSHAWNEPLANLPAEDVLVDSVSVAVAAGGKVTMGAAAIYKLPIAKIVKLQTKQAENAFSDKQLKATQFHKAAKKWGINKAASERAVHTLSWLSFSLSMAGLVLLIITLAASAPLLPFALSFLSFLAAIITSRNAISQIKKNPEQFSGKGFARAGFIISLIMLLVYVAFILYVLAFAGAF
jgi:hypothetical protein